MIKNLQNLKPVKHAIFAVVLLLICQLTHAQTMGTMTDPRDGQTYKTVTFEGMVPGKSITWMAQNLNYKTSGSYAYDNDEKFRNDMGLLFTWETAMKACPKGWHLPSDNEWDILVNKFGGDAKAGEALKSEQGWNDGGNGSDSSRFNALPAGYRYIVGSFFGLGEYGCWWSSTTSGEDKAWFRYLYYYVSKVSRYDYFKVNAFSCRCVRD